jgi:SAM-dependent methyltransferase
VDVPERLSLEQVGARTVLASEHVHRYELVAGLCGGLRVVDVCCGSGYGCRILRQAGAAKVLGVDADVATIEAARETIGREDEVEFELSDAVEFLERDLGEWDVIVLFEGLEHLEDPERAVRALERYCEAGGRCAISVPNGRVDVDNPFHLTDFDHAAASATLRRLGSDHTLLYQYEAEGSLIRGAEPGMLEGRFLLPEQGEPELCSNFIGLVNLDHPGTEEARMELAVAPVNRRYVVDLERQNERMWEQSRELAREYERAVEDRTRAEGVAAHRQAELESVEASLSWRITAPLRAAKRRLRQRSGRPS